ncbi:MAG: hypothetical protein H7Y13_03740 [Sphingobacteriaceae bacterium]|nr:hypothetical protein [Sphingobacteriaceae bacterium]
MSFLEISQWCNPRSVLVVNEAGKLKRLNCPFTVICIDAVGDLDEFMLYQVSSVKMTEQGKIVYNVAGNFFFHSAFKIIEQ